MIDKRVASLADALSGVRDGSTVLVAGFGDVGIANSLIEALQEQRRTRSHGRRQQHRQR